MADASGHHFSNWNARFFCFVCEIITIIKSLKTNYGFMRYTHNPAAPGYRVSTFILHICAFDTFEMRNKTISTDGNVHANCIHGTFNSLSNCAARTHDGNRSAKHKNWKIHCRWIGVLAFVRTWQWLSSGRARNYMLIKKRFRFCAFFLKCVVAEATGSAHTRCNNSVEWWEIDAGTLILVYGFQKRNFHSIGPFIYCFSRSVAPD